MHFLNNRDLIGGLLMAGVGLAFFVGSFNYPLGTLQRMGSGLFPMGLSALLCIFGLIVAAGAVRSQVRLPKVAWRPLVAISASITGFIYVLGSFGLIPAVVFAAAVAALGDNTIRPRDLVILIVPFATFIYVVFIYALGLPIPAFRM